MNPTEISVQDAGKLPYLLAAAGLLAGTLWAFLHFAFKSRRDRESIRLESLIAEAYRQLRALGHSPKPLGFEQTRHLLREVQSTVSRLSNEQTRKRLEARAMRLLEEGAKYGITVSPEEVSTRGGR